MQILYPNVFKQVEYKHILYIENPKQFRKACIIEMCDLIQNKGQTFKNIFSGLRSGDFF